MKKFILPALIIVMGTGAAFATNTAEDGAAAIVKGYRITANPMQPCEETSVDCSTVFSQNLCTDGSVTLHQIDGTSCGSDLYRP